MLSLTTPVRWLLCVALCALPCASRAEGRAGGKDRFAPEQIRDFHHREVVGGGIEAKASIVTYHKFTAAAEGVFSYAFGDLRRVALLFDPARPDSDVSRLNAAAGGAPVPVSKETLQLLGLAKRMYRDTRGAFDVVAEGAGTAGDIKLNRGAGTAALGRPGMRIRLDHLLDGYLADLLLVNLWNANLDNILVQVGAAARSTGRDMVGPWRLNIADVTGRYAARGISVSFSNLSAATVGAGHRAPTVDFRTRQPLTPACRGATVLSRDAATSLAIANAVYAVGPVAGLQLAQRLQSRAVIMANDGTLLKSPGL